MPRFPVIGGDDDVWGTVLNEFLQVAHQADGTPKHDVSFLSGLVANRPLAATANTGMLFFATDVDGGTLYRSSGTGWVQVARGVTQAPAAHKATHASGGSDPVTPSDIGAVEGPASATDNAIVRFNLATGKIIKSSNVTIADGGSVTLPDAANISVGSVTGTVIGTAATQKIGFYNVVPVAQPASTSDLRQALINLGLLAAGATPLNLNGGSLTANNVAVNSATDFGSGTGVVGIKDATTAPSTNPVGGIVLYSQSGALKTRQSNGSVVRIDSIIAHSYSYGGTLSVKTGTHRLYCESSAVLVSARVSVGTAPAGADIIIDIKKNGVSIYGTLTNRPTITAGTNTGVGGAASAGTFAAGDYITVDIVQVGSTTAGSDMTATVSVRNI